MAKQLNVDLRFNADTSAAKAQIQGLQTQLNGLLTSSTIQKELGITKSATQAREAVSNLKIAVENAVNVDTGRLNMNKFQQSLKESGMTLQQYAAQLKSLGPEGQQAFSALTQSIQNADTKVFQLGGKLKELKTTLSNTFRWQISAGVLQGIMSTIQGAYQYAQDLNESLNNIRIVTGYGADKMNDFAIAANKAAKELSTTTNAYTNASLIYYQQGLDDKAVKARTDVTIKLANVVGENAETVSEWMTAIWNNFDDGTESLEKYADVLAKLGAATASSADEIAQGLEKFSAVANTVGLSYNNAAAALATVTAQTRQSADIVGTAFKTLFARMEGLKLGETLDDGTTLNQYSQALMAVGINIKDQNNELKDMDTIIDEMGNKWQTLNKDQQIALAQSVGGIRQYNQLIALMDNYDMYKQNVEMAKMSEGTLQSQQDIYAESWEAANKRVKASAEDLYKTLLNDEFFIKLTNDFAKFIDFIDDLIDGLGGLKTVLPMITGLILAMVGPKVTEKLQIFGQNMAYAFNPLKIKK